MAPAFDLDRLPAALQPEVAHALANPADAEGAIDALERHVRAGAGPDARIALALLGFQEAAQIVLSQLEPAAVRALTLIDEARSMGAPLTEGLARFRAVCTATLKREEARERLLLIRALSADASPAELTTLAHRLLARGGDDPLASGFLERIAEPDRAA